MNPVEDKDAAICWACDLMARGDWLILDTETTGLKDAEICQIGMLQPSGQVLLDAMVCPTRRIPEDATAIHGITNEHVCGALKPERIIFAIDELTKNMEVVIYNCPYDKGVLGNVFRIWSEEQGKPSFQSDGKGFERWADKRRWSCAMLRYSAFVGEIGKYGNDYKWQKLPGNRAHAAIEDCRATLDMIKMMAATPLSTEAEPALIDVQPVAIGAGHGS